MIDRRFKFAEATSDHGSVSAPFLIET